LPGDRFDQHCVASQAVCVSENFLLRMRNGPPNAGFSHRQYVATSLVHSRSNARSRQKVSFANLLVASVVHVNANKFVRTLYSSVVALVLAVFLLPVFVWAAAAPVVRATLKKCRYDVFGNHDVLPCFKVKLVAQMRGSADIAPPRQLSRSRLLGGRHSGPQR
jgi:hypothetical protein